MIIMIVLWALIGGAFFVWLDPDAVSYQEFTEEYKVPLKRFLLIFSGGFIVWGIIIIASINEEFDSNNVNEWFKK